MGCPAPCASSGVGTVLGHPPWQRLDPLNLCLHVRRSFLGSFFGKLPASAPRRGPRHAPPRLVTPTPGRTGPTS